MRVVLLLMLIAGAAALTGCERIAPVRTLPSWVRGIYIPMVKNDSYEPEIEETATILTQEAFIADGQVNVVRKEDADAALLIKIEEWDSIASGSSGDRITDEAETTLVASVKLVEPYDEQAVIADLGLITVMRNFQLDTRSTRYDPEPVRKFDLLQQLAWQVVGRTLTGFPAVVGPYGAAMGQQAPTDPRDVRPLDPIRPRAGERAYGY